MNDEFRALVSSARASQKAGDLAAAEKACRSALDLAPSDVGARKVLAGILRSGGRLDEAEVEWLRLTQANAEDVGAWVELGHVRRMQSRLEEAEAAYRRALEVRPHLPAAHAGVGQVLRRLGNRDGALAAYREAWAAEPSQPQWAFEAARELQALGQIAEAMAACRAALVVAPDHVPALRLTATLHRAAGELAEAALCYQEICRLLPSEASAHVDLGNVYRDIGQTGDALRCYQDALTLDQNCLPALTGLAWLHRNAGEHAEAVSYFERAALAQADNAKLRVEVAREYQRLGRTDDALAWCRDALARDPRLTVAHRLLTRLCRNRPRGEAVAALREALAQAPDDTFLMVELARELADADEVDEAESLVDRALTIAPHESGAIRLRIRLLRKRGAFDEARAHIEHIIATAPDDPAILHQWAAILREIGDVDAAKTAYGRILARGQDVSAELALAGIAMEAGHFPEAEQSLRGIVERFPAEGKAYVMLAACLKRVGEPQQALEILQRGLVSSPGHAGLLTTLANDFCAQGAFERALAILAEALRMDPGRLDLQLQFGRCLRASGERGKAASVFALIVSAHPGRADAELELATELFALGRPDAAQKHLTEAARIGRGNVGILTRVLNFARMAEDTAEQERICDVLLSRHQDHVSSYVAAAQALAELGKVDRAQQALALGRRRFGPRAEFASIAADILRHDGRYPEALEALTSAGDAAAINAAFLSQLLTVRIGLGGYDEAEAVLRSPAAAILGPHKVHSFLGRVADGQRDVERAIAEYETALRHHPEDGGAHTELARLYMLHVDPDRASMHLHKSAQISRSTRLLRGQSVKPSQTHIGQILDEFKLDRDVLRGLRAAQHMPQHARAARLATIVAAHPDNTAAAITLLLALQRLGKFRRPEPSGTMTIPRRIYQFWDVDPPDDIGALMRLWQAHHPHWTYQAFDDKSAGQYLREHCGPDVYRAYRRSAHPAQRADLFRLAILSQQGGFYFDADDRCLGPLDDWLTGEVTYVGYQEIYGTIGNNFMGVVPNHPVVVRALADGVKAVLRGDHDILWLSTGPGLITRSFAAEIAATWPSTSLLDRTWLMGRSELQHRIGIHCRLNYKKTDLHWVRQKAGRRPPAQ